MIVFTPWVYHLLPYCRSSSQGAAVAFAVATAGSSNPKDHQDEESLLSENLKKKVSISSSAATMRVLSVMRHWITKHSQDFDDSRLKTLTKEFLEDILCSPNLVPAEQKAATQLLRFEILIYFA